MLSSVGIVAYLLLLVVAMNRFVAIYRSRRVVNATLALHAAFILYYVFVPILAFATISSPGVEPIGYLKWIAQADVGDAVNAWIYTAIAYTTLIASSSMSSANEMRVAANHLGRHGIDGTRVASNARAFAIALGVVTLGIGIIAQYAVAGYLGGFIDAVTYGDRLRAFGADGGKYLPAAVLFAIPLMICSLASLFLLAYAFRMHRSLPLGVLLAIATASSAFYLMFNAGRLGVILVLLAFLGDLFVRKTRHPYLYLAIASIVAIRLLGVLDDFFRRLSYGDSASETSGGFANTINEFAFPYSNLLHVDKINERFGLAWGVDLISWVFNTIPNSILQALGLAKITSSYNYITDYYSGANPSAGTPTDLVTLGIRQFGAFGIVIVCVLAAALCRSIDRAIASEIYADRAFIAFRIASIGFVIVPYADLDSFLRNRYDMILLAVFSLLVHSVNRGGMNDRRRRRARSPQMGPR